MGYSYTKQAGDTMAKIEAAAKATQNDPNSSGSTNEYIHKGKAHFWEIDRKDQADGGLEGEVQVMDADGVYCRRLCRFKIGGDGKVLRGPAFFKKAANAAARPDVWACGMPECPGCVNCGRGTSNR